MYFIFSTISHGQSCYISYTYDSSGIRISRTFVGSCAKTSNIVQEAALSAIDDSAVLSSENEIIEQVNATYKMFPNPTSNELY